MTASLSTGVRIQVPESFYWELYCSEVDTCGVEAPPEHIEFADFWYERQPAQLTGNHRLVIELPVAQAQYLLAQLPYHLDRWGDWGKEGRGHIRVGQRLLKELAKELEREPVSRGS